MTQNQEQLFYNKLYKNKIIILKIGGTEIASKKIVTTIKQIKKLAQKNIKFIIVFGGGVQIDNEWSRHHKKPRPKKDGIGVTTKEVLEQAVVPAHLKIIDFFQKQFTKKSSLEMNFLNPQDVVCKYKNKQKFGEVGKVININLPKKIPAINIVGFVGQLKNKQSVNINADEIVLSFFKKINVVGNCEVAEIIFLTSKGCVLDIKNNKVSVMTHDVLNQVINGKEKNIKAEGGMLQKLKEIKKLLPQIPKIAITNLESLAKELETWKGSGTLILDTRQHVIEKINSFEKPMIEKILRYQKKSDKTFFRDETELKKLLASHYIFKIKNSPLGGFSLFENDKKLEIKALWSDYIGVGINRIMIRDLQKQAKDKNKIINFYHPLTPSF